MVLLGVGALGGAASTIVVVVVNAVAVAELMEVVFPAGADPQLKSYCQVMEVCEIGTNSQFAPFDCVAVMKEPLFTTPQ